VSLQKILMVEIFAIIIVVVFVAIFVEVTPYLAASKQSDQIGVFNQRIYDQQTVTLQAGQRASSRFNYTTYDPAILVVDLKFQNWLTPGNLSLYCNGILIGSFAATPNNPDVQLTTVTFSGYDLVKPPTPKSGISFLFSYGNEISIQSPDRNGYEGTFNYQISIRGSR
jgi:hypothetical protein